MSFLIYYSNGIVVYIDIKISILMMMMMMMMKTIRCSCNFLNICSMKWSFLDKKDVLLEKEKKREQIEIRKKSKQVKKKSILIFFSLSSLLSNKVCPSMSERDTVLKFETVFFNFYFLFHLIIIIIIVIITNY